MRDDKGLQHSSRAPDAGARLGSRTSQPDGRRGLGEGDGRGVRPPSPKETILQLRENQCLSAILCMVKPMEMGALRAG